MDWNKSWIKQPAPKLTLGNADFMQAVETFNAQNSVLAVVESHNIELKRIGKEYHSVNGCPLCGGEDRFVVWPARGQTWCRHCPEKTWGDALKTAMRLESIDPNGKGNTARFLIARGYLQSKGNT